MKILRSVKHRTSPWWVVTSRGGIFGNHDYRQLESAKYYARRIKAAAVIQASTGDAAKAIWGARP